ncbi:MAG: histidine phosphatase family protein [Lachnospiraceae bacterium]|nr:histidine phosphatase family protein [Lachnospiraceae bacterium]
MKVYLVRHGETDWNRECRLQGQSDTVLNEIGIELAEITAKELKDTKFDMIYSSPLRRAYMTAEIFNRGRELEILTDKRLLEINFGEREGHRIPGRDDDDSNPIYNFEFRTEAYNPPEGGESFDDVFARTADFWDKEIVPLEGKCENILIIGHGCMNRTIINRLLGNPIGDFWKIKLDNCAVSIIDITDGKSTVLEASHKYYSRDNDRFRLPAGTTAIYG